MHTRSLLVLMVAATVAPGLRSAPDNPGVVSTRADAPPRPGAAAEPDRPPAFILPTALEKSTNAAVRDAVIRTQVCDRQKDAAGALQNLKEAETAAQGREKSALRLEIAQRLRDTQRPAEAEAWFRKLAEGADQPALRQYALDKAEAMKREAQKPRRKGPAPEPKGKAP